MKKQIMFALECTIMKSEMLTEVTGDFEKQNTFEVDVSCNV